MWQDYISVKSEAEVLQILAERGERARIVAGATDLILEIERGVRQGIDTLIDISRIACFDEIAMDEDETIHLGPLVTHNHCVASKLIRDHAFPLAQAAWEVGAPQIRNRGTVAGNLITASPANDTIPALMALGASVTLASFDGRRTLPLSEFYTGVRKTVMRRDEMLVDISFKAMESNQRGMFIKLGLRRAQAIAVVNAAVVITFASRKNIKLENRKIDKVLITLGSVAPTIIHVPEAEVFLKGKILNNEIISQSSKICMRSAKPIDDVRGSAVYRREMIRVCISRILHAIWKGEEQAGFPEQPVFLWGKNGTKSKGSLKESCFHTEKSAIVTSINGKNLEILGGQNKTLLRLLREDAGLTGTKEGCAEGECGACTVFLDGKAVMACLVPAARAHNAEIITIESLAEDGILHPVQKTFVDEGAVQCGYCTPGFIMSAAKLIEEHPAPNKNMIEWAITGNLCRCTGYYKILQSIEKACAQEVTHG